MSLQHLTSFERKLLDGLSSRAGLAASLFDAWSGMPAGSIQTERSLIDVAQLNVTEERAARQVLQEAVSLGLLEESGAGFQARGKGHLMFPRLAFALNAVEHYLARVHRDATLARIVLTRPPQPSIL